MNKLYEILSAKAAMPADWIKHTTPIEDLEIESLDFIEMVFEIEEAFDVKIPAEWDTSLPPLATYRTHSSDYRIPRHLSQNNGTPAAPRIAARKTCGTNTQGTESKRRRGPVGTPRQVRCCYPERC